MTRGLWTMWALTAALSATAVGIAGNRCWSARQSALGRIEQVRTLRNQSERLAALRASAPSWASGQRPGAGLTPRVSAALAASGLPASTMSGFSPEAESSVGEGELRARRSRAVVTLAPVTLPQLGTFLAAWREREPAWTVSSLDLSPQAEKTDARSAGRDLPLRVVIGLETLFVDRGGAK